MNQPYRIPETMSPRDIGAYMGSLREQFNLTQQEVSQRLHIRPRYVSAIEEGRFELMPGKVYARGYIHTYAEFLGLDAQQVAAQCFADDKAPAAAPAYSPRPARRSLASRNWQGFGIATTVALLAVLVFTQISGSGDKDAPVAAPAVAPVPEAMLQSVRNLVMPTPQNLDCLSGATALACFYDGSLMQLIDQLENNDSLHFVGDLDVSSVPLAEPAAAHETPPTDDVPAASSADE